MPYAQAQEFLTLLKETRIFEDSTKQIIARACELETLPQADYDYLFDVLKLEANMNHMLDKKAEEKIHALKKKYGKDTE